MKISMNERAGRTGSADDDGAALKELGAAVRLRRRALGMRQGDLAAAAGLSVPFVSQIETGFASPSLMSLFAIARVLDTTPERLLAGPTPDQVTVVRSNEGRVYAVTDAEKSAHRRQLTALHEPFSGSEYVVEPGADLGGYAASSGREMINMIEGQMIIDIVLDDGTEVSHHLHAGDTLIYNTSATHRWRHAGKRTARFLLVVSEHPETPRSVSVRAARRATRASEV
jgi:transcriptional regulator with XRE-family HTH domain